MKKVAILGIENSHAWSFAKSLAGKDGTKVDETLELVGFYADMTREDGRTGAAKLQEVSTCDYFAETAEEFVGKVDAVMITSRHGKFHLPFARPYLERGIPVWVDKPICTSTEDVLELVKLAKQTGSPITGGSSLIFSKEILEMAEYAKSGEKVIGGHVTAPVNMVNDYGNFWFYSSHLVQMVIAVFGPDIKSVSAHRQGDHVSAVYHYENMDVTAYFGTGYSVTVYQTPTQAKSITVTTAGCYDAELNEFCRMVRTGKGVESYHDFVLPVFVIDATIRAFEENRTVEISIPEI
ncbi:MAG: Gfo/Idh/MocA family oxidoreductase [Oscillospiraceae bacterium]|nr:Gfo/Idh/MocA family oxidoreductase [Oscillospiraceae bacterium]